MGSSAHRENHCSIGRVNAIACDLLMREVWTGVQGEVEIREGERSKKIPAFHFEAPTENGEIQLVE